MRRGKFMASMQLPNQCRSVETTEFIYDFRCVIRCILDSNTGYTVDHEPINEIVQNTSLAGSCEGMAVQIAEAARRFVEQQKNVVYVVAYQCTVSPLGGVVAAFTYTHINREGEGYAHLLHGHKD
jgi:hypothetical protein